jgi:hypothetical protein
MQLEPAGKFELCYLCCICLDQLNSVTPAQVYMLAVKMPVTSRAACFCIALQHMLGWFTLVQCMQNKSMLMHVQGSLWLQVAGHAAPASSSTQQCITMLVLLLLLQVLAGIGLPRDPAAFYQQLHSYLTSLGIDGVKVDVQVW